MVKTWFHKVDIPVTELDRELNTLSMQGWEIYKIWKVGYDKYEIIAYRTG